MTHDAKSALPAPLLFNRCRHLSPRIYPNGKKLKGLARDPEFGAIFGSLAKREVEIKYCSRCSAGGNASGIIKRPSNRGRVRRMPAWRRILTNKYIITRASVINGFTHRPVSAHRRSAAV